MCVNTIDVAHLATDLLDIWYMCVLVVGIAQNGNLITIIENC